MPSITNIVSNKCGMAIFISIFRVQSIQRLQKLPFRRLCLGQWHLLEHGRNGRSDQCGTARIPKQVQQVSVNVTYTFTCQQ